MCAARAGPRSTGSSSRPWSPNPPSYRRDGGGQSRAGKGPSQRQTSERRPEKHCRGSKECMWDRSGQVRSPSSAQTATFRCYSNKRCRSSRIQDRLLRFLYRGRRMTVHCSRWFLSGCTVMCTNSRLPFFDTVYITFIATSQKLETPLRNINHGWVKPEVSYFTRNSPCSRIGNNQ